MKRENKSINKNKLTEVTGSRSELKQYIGEDLDVDAFVTNTLGYMDQKRLVTEVRIGDYFINHVWFKTEKIGDLKHGYQKLQVRVTEYMDQTTNESKYGLKYTGTKGNKYQNTFLVKPKWMDQ